MGAASMNPTLDTIVLGVGEADRSRSETLVDAVEELARPTDARVVFVHIFDTKSYKETVEHVLDHETGRVDPNELADQMTVIRDMREQLSDEIQYETRAATRKKGDGIVAIAEDVDADRVVVGGHRRSPSSKAILGSTVQTVLLNAPCPVTFVRDT
ncbi:universal stress protein [Natrialba aegyptia]|uniref:UspA domain-containing protein n=1 Tax=Natrialba aegyptia DSM 13077 TaxID=1227491 RepID=M0AH35_9EURY|nr:universal stress protein [Natrialba aegyptia]ELY97681.1 UspA domain-containing protein [Natrialba aegyptia DSM 13077]